MPTSAWNKFNQYVEDRAHKVHDHSSDTHKIALTNSAPVATNELLSEITEVAYTYLASGQTLVLSSSGQTSGVYNLIFDDFLLQATGGDVGPFRYAVMYNDTPSSPLDPLMGWHDYGSSVTLQAGEALNLDLDGVNGLFSDT